MGLDVKTLFHSYPCRPPFFVVNTFCSQVNMFCTPIQGEMQNTSFSKKLEIEAREFTRGYICGCTDTTNQITAHYRLPDKSGTKPPPYAPSFIILFRHATRPF